VRDHVGLAYFPDQLHAVHTRHVLVYEIEIEGSSPRLLQRFRGVARTLHVPARLLECESEDSPNGVLIVYD
jgi:hypothetical protein